MRRFVRAAVRSGQDTILRALRGGEILLFSLPLLLFVPGAVLLTQLGVAGQQGALVVALPEAEPGGLRLSAALAAAGLEAVPSDDPGAALQAGDVGAAVIGWQAPAGADAAWRIEVRTDGRTSTRTRLREALLDARELALAEQVPAAGGDVVRDLQVLEVIRSTGRGRPRMRILMGSILLLSALAASLLLPRDLSQDRDQGVLEATFVTQSAVGADLAGRALGFCLLVLWAPSVSLVGLGLFRGLLVRMGFQPVYVVQLATGVFALCVLALLPGVVARTAAAAVPWSIGVLWCSLGLALASIVVDAPGLPIVGTGTPAPLALQLLTVAGNLGLGVGGLLLFSWWIEGAWALGSEASR